MFTATAKIRFKKDPEKILKEYPGNIGLTRAKHVGKIETQETMNMSKAHGKKQCM